MNVLRAYTERRVSHLFFIGCWLSLLLSTVAGSSTKLQVSLRAVEQRSQTVRKYLEHFDQWYQEFYALPQTIGGGVDMDIDELFSNLETFLQDAKNQLACMEKLFPNSKVSSKFKCIYSALRTEISTKEAALAGARNLEEQKAIQEENRWEDSFIKIQMADQSEDSFIKIEGELKTIQEENRWEDSFIKIKGEKKAIQKENKSKDLFIKIEEEQWVNILRPQDVEEFELL